MPYELNLQRNMLALSFHFDLAHSSGRALGLNHAGAFRPRSECRKREPHVLWLKYSYLLRQLVSRSSALDGSRQSRKGRHLFLQARS